MSELSFATLRCRFQTGRSYVVSGTGRNRIYGYRNGVMCQLGDIERSEWIEMVKDMIRRSGEQKLYEQLLQHLKDHNYAKESKSELEFKALELQADRIFDNELWVDFLKFNSKYRPEIVACRMREMQVRSSVRMQGTVSLKAFQMPSVTAERILPSLPMT